VAEAYVFKYLVNDLLAVAVVPVECATFHMSGRHRVVLASQGEHKHMFVVDPADAVEVLPFDQALARARGYHQELVDSGQISPDIFPPPPQQPARPVQFQGGKRGGR
jgi:hypothetical protein